MVRSWAATGISCEAHSGQSITCGWCQVPEATAAATEAICSGLASTLPWPIASSAASAGEAGVAMLPPWLVIGNGDPAPNPYNAAACVTEPLGRFLAIPMKAVLQLFAKA